jgi:hypothetical protein
VKKGGREDMKSPGDLFLEPLRNEEGRLDRNARMHANLQIQVKNALNARKGRRVIGKR